MNRPNFLPVRNKEGYWYCTLITRLGLRPHELPMRHCLSSTFANLSVIGFWQCPS